jgi:hypothetical protein
LSTPRAAIAPANPGRLYLVVLSSIDAHAHDISSPRNSTSPPALFRCRGFASCRTFPIPTHHTLFAEAQMATTMEALKVRNVMPWIAVRRD